MEDTQKSTSDEVISMAGPGKPGPAARGHEQVEWHRTKVQVVDLLDQGLSKEEIAHRIGYRDRGQVNRLIDRVMREDLVNAGAERLRARELRRLDDLYNALLPALYPPDGSPPSPQTVNSAVGISRAVRELMGLDLPKKLDIEVTTPEGSQEERLMAFAERVNRLGYLMDRAVVAGIGSGRSTDDQIKALNAGASSSVA